MARLVKLIIIIFFSVYLPCKAVEYKVDSDGNMHAYIKRNENFKIFGSGSIYEPFGNKPPNISNVLLKEQNNDMDLYRSIVVVITGLYDYRTKKYPQRILATIGINYNNGNYRVVFRGFFDNKLGFKGTKKEVDIAKRELAYVQRLLAFDNKDGISKYWEMSYGKSIKEPGIGLVFAYTVYFDKFLDDSRYDLYGQPKSHKRK